RLARHAAGQAGGCRAGRCVEPAAAAADGRARQIGQAGGAAAGGLIRPPVRARILGGGACRMRTNNRARMKRSASGLLAGAALLYILASLLEHRPPAWGYVAAFSDAAMVGAIADWFAVVALFR